MEKTKGTAFKEMLFTYLAISKFFYWMNTISALNLSDAGNVGQAVLERFLNQDFLIIAGVVVFFWLERTITLRKSKYSKVWENMLFYGIGFVILTGMIVGYTALLNLIFVRTLVLPSDGGTFLMTTFVIYAMMMSVLNFKDYLKRKEKAIYANKLSVRSAGDRLTMLQALLDDGVLTQDEFDCKEKMV